MSRALALAILLTTAALAGCLGEGDDGAVNASAIPETTAPPEQAQEGNVIGAVTDPAQVPIPGAEVYLLRNETVGTQTARDGTYKLEDVAAGEHLIRAEADGYVGETFLVKVKSGRTTVLDAALVPESITEPYHETRELAGLLDCSSVVASADTPQARPCVNFDDNARSTFVVDVAPEPARVLLELRWEASQPLAENLYIDAQTIGTGVQDVSLGDTEGPSVLRMDIPGALMERHYPDGGQFRVNVSAAPSFGDEEGAAVGLAFEQPYTLFVTTFYVEPGPSSFSALD